MHIVYFRDKRKPMTDLEIVKHAIEEVETRSWVITEQFLEIHELIYKDKRPKIAHIDKDRPDGTVVVYFPIKDEKFYLAIYIQTILDCGYNLGWN